MKLDFEIDLKQVIKRLADWLEKLSIASLAIGLFKIEYHEVQLLGIIIGIGSFIGSNILDCIGNNLWWLGI